MGECIDTKGFRHRTTVLVIVVETGQTADTEICMGQP